MNKQQTTQILEANHESREFISPWPLDMAFKHLIDNNNKFMED
jgi:hypothetical protein